jgi:hypothetical protein
MALPSGYTQLQYIQSSGTQYIDTGFTPSGNALRIKMKFKATASLDSTSLFGSQSSAGVFSLLAYCASTSMGIYCAKSTNLTTFKVTTGGTYELDCAYSGGTLALTVNGSAQTASVSGSLYTGSTIPLFCNYNNGNVDNLAAFELISCQIYDNGTLVRDFVPALRVSGNTVGLYDLKNGVFYTNTGTGVFTAGPVYDSTAPVGDHNTLIDGTAYAVSGGKVLVGGTVYALAKGKTLVGGTAYDISFSKTVTVTINTFTEGSANVDYGYVEINGVKYTGSSGKTIEVPAGTEMICYAKPRFSMYSGYVYVNEVEVAQGKPARYTYTINGPISVKLSGATATYIRITEQ